MIRSLGFLATAAAFAVFGGLHLEIASGQAFGHEPPNDARLQTGTTIAVNPVNELSKGDRADVALNTVEGRTIVFQHPDLPSTTVAVRLWETVGAVRSRPSPKDSPALKDKKAPAVKPKQAVACESVVSALTEVAKQLDAGRCLT
ncbi:hypothetical protein [Bradyrhizobium sp. LHD-71]|uniref:hypothetical protein n=1 Tax=Bradyrhizobium sp. LHD-71 TaxID=3072141 RepID=UPI00280F0CE3|nr:hypothetical protein [Bradyrhizobium sp. LHD-71]MDQ8727039.1 hypothetical protein [Bradyrhizobium sp. LHD-71]